MIEQAAEPIKTMVRPLCFVLRTVSDDQYEPQSRFQEHTADGPTGVIHTGAGLASSMARHLIEGSKNIAFHSKCVPAFAPEKNIDCATFPVAIFKKQNHLGCGHEQPWTVCGAPAR